MFALQKINQIQWEMCSYLEWELNINPKLLQMFEHLVQEEFFASISSSIAFLPTKLMHHK
jgi:hypothetical protein